MDVPSGFFTTPYANSLTRTVPTALPTVRTNIVQSLIPNPSALPTVAHSIPKPQPQEDSELSLASKKIALVQPQLPIPSADKTSTDTSNDPFAKRIFVYHCLVGYLNAAISELKAIESGIDQPEFDKDGLINLVASARSIDELMQRFINYNTTYSQPSKPVQNVVPEVKHHKRPHSAIQQIPSAPYPKISHIPPPELPIPKAASNPDVNVVAPNPVKAMILTPMVKLSPVETVYSNSSSLDISFSVFSSRYMELLTFKSVSFEVAGVKFNLSFETKEIIDSTKASKSPMLMLVLGLDPAFDIINKKAHIKFKAFCPDLMHPYQSYEGWALFNNEKNTEAARDFYADSLLRTTPQPVRLRTGAKNWHYRICDVSTFRVLEQSKEFKFKVNIQGSN